MLVLECDDLRKTFAGGFEAVRDYLILADRALISSHWDWAAIGGALLAFADRRHDHDAAGHARVPARRLRLTAADAVGPRW